MTDVKICGLTDAAGVTAALDAGADYLGFVFADNSVRKTSPARAAELAKPARGKAKIVAVLVNPGDKLIKKVVSTLAPDVLQLHGRETPERVRTIWKRYHIPIIKAFAVSSKRDVQDTERYARTAAYYLLDARPPKGAGPAGGHGAAFDWDIIDQDVLAKPWFLAGGLTPQNVAGAIARTGAKMVDVSSGVESAAGVKDPARITAFIQAVRQHEDKND